MSADLACEAVLLDRAGQHHAQMSTRSATKTPQIVSVALTPSRHASAVWQQYELLPVHRDLGWPPALAK